MVRRFLKLREFGEKHLHEFLDAAVTIRVLRPVVGDQYRAHRDRADIVPLFHHSGIVAMAQYRRQIIGL